MRHARGRPAGHPADVDAPFGALSGGNKQKVVFGRALLREADVYVLCEPTRGVDVVAREEIYELVRRLPDERTGGPRDHVRRGGPAGAVRQAGDGDRRDGERVPARRRPERRTTEAVL